MTDISIQIRRMKMKSLIVVLLAGLMLISANVFAQDILIDSSGNIEVGATNTYGKLKVVGDSGRDAVEGVTSGTGYAVHGVNATAGGFAGYFEGDAVVTGDLAVGTINGSTVGDITTVLGGFGLSNVGDSGDVTLNVTFGGTGTADAAARSNHDHDTIYSSTSHGHSNLVSIAGGIMTGTLNLPLNGLVVGSNQIVASGGNVGIGMSTNASRLAVAGMIESTSEGIKFPDGSVQNTAFVGGYSGVAVVAVNGGDFNDPITAMDEIGNSWCGEGASASEPCLVKIMPGVYNIGAGTLQMQSYVDIEGSGEAVTKITGTAGNSGAIPTSGVVSGAGNAEIRMLTVENTSAGIGIHASGIYNSSSSPKVSDVALVVSSGHFSRGMYNFTSSPELNDVTITVTGTQLAYGIENSSSSPEINNVHVDAVGGTSGYGISNTGTSTVEVTHSKIKGSTDSINAGIGAITFVANSKLDGGVTAPPLTVTCAGVFRVNYEFYGSACPTY